ncbi:MAG: cardiolipin synthase [Faecalibacillus faecis]
MKGQMNYLNQQRYPTYYGQDLKYFSLGDDAFEPLLEDLINAMKFIFMQFFIVDEVKMLTSVLDILKQKVQEGVEVRFMYDDVGSLTMLPRHYYRQLEKMGIQSVAFNPFVPFLSLAMNNRDHKKIVVVDGKIGFSGGFNLADEYINQRVKYGHWKDSGLMIHGEAVNSLTKLFLESWNVAKNSEEDYEKYYVHEENKENDGFGVPYGDSPLDDESVGENVYLNMINQSHDYLYITTPYLILDDNLQTALINASKRGVDVRIITPGIPDKKLVFRVTRSYYQTLMKHGIRIYEYTPGFIHAKNFLVDDKCATVGTINLDYRSLYLHFENGIYLYNNKILKDIKEDFSDSRKVS